MERKSIDKNLLEIWEYEQKLSDVIKGMYKSEINEFNLIFPKTHEGKYVHKNLKQVILKIMRVKNLQTKKVIKDIISIFK